MRVVHLAQGYRETECDPAETRFANTTALAFT
jgi:hypothetical protein